MDRETGVEPMIRWDGVHVVVHLPALERLLRRRLAAVPALEDLELAGRDDCLSLTFWVQWKGVSTRVRVDVREIRLKQRRLGFRVSRAWALGGFPIPKAAVLRTLKRSIPDLITVVPNSDIVIVDLQQWLPSEISFRVITVQIIGTGLHLWLGGGSISDVPGAGGTALPGGETVKPLPQEGLDTRKPLG